MWFSSKLPIEWNSHSFSVKIKYMMVNSVKIKTWDEAVLCIGLFLSFCEICNHHFGFEVKSLLSQLWQWLWRTYAFKTILLGLFALYSCFHVYTSSSFGGFSIALVYSLLRIMFCMQLFALNIWVVFLYFFFVLSSQIVLLLRLVPLLPFNMLNYLLSVTPVRIGEYMLASWLGMMVFSSITIYIVMLAWDWCCNL